MKSVKQTDILTGSIPKQLLLFFLPIWFGTLFQQLYNTADTLIVGNFVGTNALAAVGAIDDGRLMQAGIHRAERGDVQDGAISHVLPDAGQDEHEQEPALGLHQWHGLHVEELAQQHITPSTVRLSIGTEYIDDIIDDLDQAFAKI